MSQKDLPGTLFGEEEQPPPPAATRRERHAPAMKPRGRHRWVVLLVAIALVGGAGYAGYAALKPVISGVFGGTGTADVDYPGPGTGEVSVVIEAGATGEDIATTLRDLGVTKTRTAYLDAAAGDPQSAAKIQPGSYVLRSQMRGQDAFERLIDPASRVTDRVTVREGLWASETYAALSKATGVPVKEYEKAAKDTTAIGLPPEAGGNMEGWLFPSSYEFSDKTTATTQLKTMVAQTVTVLDAAGVAPKDREDVLTLASLVEAEAKLDVDRPKIARVFLNRIETKGPPTYGLLQSDAAVSYGAKRRALFPSKSELEDPDNPYNTRIHPGLPPGPISNPGKASIDAAGNPADGPWFFFVAVNPITGETKYAVTLDQHNANVRELNAYCAAKPQDCGQ
ncbi:MAG: endolytic transglycosylase MltG [Ornithinibacter sp.]